MYRPKPKFYANYMSPLQKLEESYPQIEKQIGYVFRNKKYLELAFTHRSFVNENKDLGKRHNERLEFLGDAILGLVISEFLYRELPLEAEGNLSYLRSRIVEASTCAAFLLKLEVGDFLLMGRGEMMNSGRGRASVLSDLFEAIIGAIYLDGGLEKSGDFFFRHFKEEVMQIIQKPLKNWKAEVQDYSQKNYQTPPRYEVFKEEGPDHEKVFHVAIYLNDKKLGEGAGRSKKDAEQNAAEIAMRRIES